MSEQFEERLRVALLEGAQDAPRASGLADAARTRARTRRRRGAGVVLAALVTAGLALPVGAALLEDRQPGPAATPLPPERSSRADRPQVPMGWHVERWRGLEVQVPNTWGEGRLSTWCRRDGGVLAPVVERPGTGAEARPCRSPALGYGVQFLRTDRVPDLPASGLRRYRPSAGRLEYEAGAWVGVSCSVCDVAVRVVSPDEYVARYLLSTVRRVDGDNADLP